MQNLKEVVKKLLDTSEGEGEVLSTYFFQSEARGVEDDDLKYYESADEFVQACKAELVNYHYEDSFGGEGQGEDYWSVYSFTNGTDVVYVKFNGWYASYSGSEFTEWFFVEPKKVEVVQYVAA